MTGVSWGSYQDYVRGEWDGVKHYDDAQASAGGFKLEHGGLESLAYQLHNLYSAFEDLFLIVAKHFENTMVSGR